MPLWLLGLIVIAVVANHRLVVYGYTNIAYSSTVETSHHAHESSTIQPMLSSNVAYGGDRIVNPGAFFSGGEALAGTIGFNAICNDTGLFGIVTNAHITLTNVVYHNRALASNRLGRAVPGQSIYDNRGIDASFTPFQNQNNWQVTPNARYGDTTFTNIRLAPNPERYFVGARILKIGQTNGVNSGRIFDFREYRDVIDYTNISDPGDSGGPFFRYFPDRPNDLYLLGIHSHGHGGYLAPGGYGTRIDRLMYRIRVTPICLDIYNLEFYISNNEVTVIGISPGRTNVLDIRIPAYFRGLPVRHIGANAFANRTDIYRIALPSGLRTIGTGAFAHSSVRDIIMLATVGRATLYPQCAYKMEVTM